MGLSKEELLKRMDKSKLNGISEPIETPEINFTEIEKQLLTSAFSEATQTVNDHQQLQQLLQQKHDAMIGATKSADKVYRAIMIMKGINPDAFQLGWNPQTNELRLQQK
jgi:hypothetical protein